VERLRKPTIKSVKIGSATAVCLQYVVSITAEIIIIIIKMTLFKEVGGTLENEVKNVGVKVCKVWGGD